MAASRKASAPFEMTVWKGVRWSSANAYLRPALKPPQCQARNARLRRRIILDGKRAIGVEYERGGKIRSADANREVILAASALNSPKLLMLSGIGPAEHLKEVGHRAGSRSARRRPESAGSSRSLFPDGRLQAADHAQRQASTLFSKGVIGSNGCCSRRGLGATNHFESCGFIRTARRRRISRPRSITSCPSPSAMTARRPPRDTAIRCMSGRTARNRAAGCKLRSNDPKDPPRVLLQLHVASARTGADFRTGIRLTREILAQDALRALSRPGDSAGRSACSRDAEIDGYHPRSRARAPITPAAPAAWASPDDPLAVVDPECRVIGIERPARRRCVDHSDGHQRQSQRALPDDRREGVRSHSGPRSAAALQSGAVDQSQLAREPEVRLGLRMIFPEKSATFRDHAVAKLRRLWLRLGRSRIGDERLYGDIALAE